MNTHTRAKTSPLTILIALGSGLVLLNILFLIFISNSIKTIGLLREQLDTQRQDEQLVASANQIYSQYKAEIELISRAFPNEENLPNLIQDLERLIRQYADEYSLRFNSVTPLIEQERLFLPLTITMKTDMPRLLHFFEKLETFNYMTHVTAVSSKFPDSLSQAGEVIVGVKVYVQNPFTSK